MSLFKTSVLQLTLAAGACLAAPCWAQAPVAPVAPGAATAATPLTDGEVRKVDGAAGKVTIRHADIKHLDMPAMTMVFTARDPGLLTSLKPGDRIRFAAVSEGGRLVVTEIRPAR